MAFLANYPIALAPAMGHNFYFAFTICGSVAMGGLGYPWQVALGANFISGALFVVLSLFKFRERIINAIPESLKHAISVGIGLLITLVGLEWAGIVVDSPGTLVGLGNLKSTPVLVSIFGILLVSVIIARKVRGAILWGILLTTVVGLLSGVVKYHGILSLPPSIAPTFGKLDIGGVFRQIDFITVIFVLFFLDLFDTVGTLVGVGTQAGFMKEGKLPRA
jgi:AGZA family xanthine/uracil permease-like MFS transporter